MPRPKKDTPAGKLASEKWHKTMTERYGNITKRMQETGRLGGLAGRGEGYKGGFAGSRELASRAGSKGGSISKRKSKYTGVFEANKQKIIDVASGSPTLKSLADELEVPYPALMNYVTRHIRNKE